MCGNWEIAWMKRKQQQDLTAANTEVVETIPWHRTDGSVIHVSVAALPLDGYGIWKYRRRAGHQESFTFALTTGPGDVVRAFIVALDNAVMAALGQAFLDERRDRYDRIRLDLTPIPLTVPEAMAGVIAWCEGVCVDDKAETSS